MAVRADGAHQERTPGVEELSCRRVPEIDQVNPPIAKS